MTNRTLPTLPDEALRGRRALVRVDFNVPMEHGVVTDDTRIRAALPTLEYLTSRGAAVVLLSHLGRPKGTRDPKYSLAPIADHLRGLTSAPVAFSPDARGAAAAAAAPGFSTKRTSGSGTGGAAMSGGAASSSPP